MRRVPSVLLAVAVLSPSLLGAPVAVAATWGGSVATVDGVPVVRNPAEGMLPPLTVQVEELWRLGGYSEAPEEFFGVIGDIVVDQSNEFYVLDTQLSEVRVFDESGAWLRTIGREGEGPGEFRRPVDLTLLPSGTLGVIQPWPTRMVLLGVTGDPAGTFSFEPEGKGFATMSAAASAGGRVALVYSVGSPGEGAFTRQVKLGLFEESGARVVDLVSADASMDYANSLCVERDWNDFDRAWAAGSDGSVYARLDFTGYRIGVWDEQGRPRHEIEREYAPHARNRAQMEAIEKRWAAGLRRWVQNPSFEIEQNWNPVESLHARDDGTLWVRTSRGTHGLADGELARFDVFDAQGRFEREIILPGGFDPENDGLFLAGGYVLVVTDLVSARDAMRGGGPEEDLGEAEPMEIICYRMDLARLAQAE